MKTVLLLLVSNVFMTFAWYGHLKYPRLPLWITIFAAWGIAFFEYCFQVPANRIGQEFYKFSGAELKVIQEAITLTVFAVFSFTYLNQPLRWNHWVAFVMIFAGVCFMFVNWESAATK